MNTVARVLLVTASLALAPAAMCAGWPFQPPATGTRLLPVADAFTPQPALWIGGRLQLQIDIAPGCYLYRDRLRVEAADPADYPLGPLSLPEGVAHEDEHFGKVTIYRERVAFGLKPSAAKPPRRLRLTYQGCAEGLVCYPPQTRLIDVIDDTQP